MKKRKPVTAVEAQEETSSSSSPSSSSSSEEEDEESKDEHDSKENDDMDVDMENKEEAPEKKAKQNKNDISKTKTSNSSFAAAVIKATSPSSPALSKSWGELQSHTSTYDGGTILSCHTLGIHPTFLYGTSSNNSTANTKPIPFLLALCQGDISIIDTTRGVTARTIRKGVVAGSASAEVAWENQNEDSFVEMDADAITTFCLARNDVDLIAASRNTVLRHYKLSSSSSSSEEVSCEDLYSGAQGKGPAIVQRTLGGRKAHELPIKVMQFHPSGVFFATGSVDGITKVWDLRGGFATHSLKKRGGGSAGGGVSALSWCPTPTHQRILLIAVGYDDGAIAIYDLHQGESSTPVVLLTNHVSTVTSIVWYIPPFPNHWKTMAMFTTGRDEVMNTWKFEITGKVMQIVKNVVQKKKAKRKHRHGKENPYRCQRVATLPVYETMESLVLLSENENEHDETTAATKTRISNMNETSEQKVKLVSAGSKGVLRVWETCVKNTPMDPSDSSHDEHDDQDDDDDDDAHESSHKALVKISALKCVQTQPATHAFGAMSGGYTSLVSLPPSFLPSEIEGKDVHGVPLMAVDAEHNLAFLSSSTLTTWRHMMSHFDEILDLRLLPSPTSSSSSSSSSSSLQTQMVVATNSPQIRLFDLQSFSCQVLDGHTDTVLCLDVSPCGRFVVSCGKDKSMRVWHVGSQRCVAIAKGHTEGIGATALSRKMGKYEVTGKASQRGAGAFVCTVSKDRTLKRWVWPGVSVLESALGEGKEEGGGGIKELECLGTVHAHDKDINIVTVAPNDSLVATGSQDKTVKLWNATSAQLTLRATLRGHKRGVWDCQFSPHDKVLATASGDATLKLWSLAEGCACLRTFQGHSASVLRVRFLTGGLQLLSSGADGLVKLWTIRTNECEATMDAHTDRVWALDLLNTTTTASSVTEDDEKEDEDGSDGVLDSKQKVILVSGGADSRIVVWRDTTVEEDRAKRMEEEHALLMEQKLMNHLRFKEYEQALEVALELNKPMQALKVLTALVENDTKNNLGIPKTITTLKKHISTWSISRTTQVLRYCRDWNTRARNSHMAMLVLRAILATIPVTTLASADGVPEILAGILPYAERHFERLDTIYGNSFLVDYTLTSTGRLVSDDDVANWEATEKYVLPPPPPLSESDRMKGRRGDDDDMDEDGGMEGVQIVGDSDSESEASVASATTASSTD